MLLAPWAALQAPFVRSAIVHLAARMHGGDPTAVPEYALAYCLGAMILVPKSLLSGLAGYAWGPWKGFVAALPSATLGACCSFGMGRLLARTDWARQWLEHPRFKQIDTVVRHEGLRVAILLRMSPVMPQPLLSMLLGATPMPLWQLVVSMLVGLAPATLLHTYVGSLVHSALELLAHDRLRDVLTPGRLAFGALSLAGTMLFLGLIGRVAKGALAKALAEVEVEVEVEVEPPASR